MSTEKMNEELWNVVRILKQAYPEGITNIQATVNHNEPRMQARIEALRRLGWPVEDRRIKTAKRYMKAYYLHPDAEREDEDVIYAGMIIRIGSKSGIKCTVHQNALKSGVVHLDLLEQARKEALAAFMFVIENHLPTQPGEVAPRFEDIVEYIDFDDFMSMSEDERRELARKQRAAK